MDGADFYQCLVHATESVSPDARIRLLEEQADGFFASPDTARYWAIVRAWDLSTAKNPMPVLIKGWLAFLCGDRVALSELAPRLQFSGAEGDSPEESSLRHALFALSGLETDASARLRHAEQAVAVLSDAPALMKRSTGSEQAPNNRVESSKVREMASANARLTLAQVLAGSEHIRQAAELFEEAERLFRAAGMPFPAAVACTNALLNNFRLGRYPLVLERAQQVLAEAASFHGEAQAWWGIVGLPAGMACSELLRPALAIRHLREAQACIDAMRLFHMHGLVEWYLFRALWLKGDVGGLQALCMVSERMFSRMRHPFLDRMLAQFRILVADVSGEPLPEADVESFTLPCAAAGAGGMWIREEMLAWLAMRGMPEVLAPDVLRDILATLRFSGNCPRLQFFLVAQAQLHLARGEIDHADACLREAVALWRETGGAAGFAMYPMEPGHREVAMLRVLAPDLHARVERTLRERKAQVQKGIADLDSVGLPDRTAVETGNEAAEAGEEAEPPSVKRPFLLTAREREILQLAASGMNNGEIGKALYLGISTVKWHINNIFSKLDAENRVQAIRTAQARGEIE